MQPLKKLTCVVSNFMVEPPQHAFAFILHIMAMFTMMHLPMTDHAQHNHVISGISTAFALEHHMMRLRSLGDCMTTVDALPMVTLVNLRTHSFQCRPIQSNGAALKHRFHGLYASRIQHCFNAAACVLICGI